MSKKMYLIFENGTVFEGKSFGAENDVIGEVVFTTGMCGYAENLSDKSYYGQIVMQTFPMIGNYGLNSEELKNKCYLKGYIVREWCEAPSNFMSAGTVDEYLKSNGITGIYGIDTRAVTRFIRENGTMNALISSSVPDDLSEICSYKLENAYKAVSGSSFVSKAIGNEKFKVTLLDFGMKKSTVEALNKLGCTVTILPYNATANDVLNTNPDGIVLSEGPESPCEYSDIVNVIKSFFGKISILGLSLGHQLLALAAGGKIEKLPYGHRGSSQPVKYSDGLRTYITEQNHGYIVTNLTNAKILFENANDGTCEGIEYIDKKALSVQFSIDTSGGPHDTSFIYRKFTDLMEGK